MQIAKLFPFIAVSMVSLVLCTIMSPEFVSGRDFLVGGIKKGG
jgi:hypothetical protein